MDASSDRRELSKNRLWVAGFVVFCVLLVVGSTVFAVARMPAMLATAIREAQRVEIKGADPRGPLVFQDEMRREALAKMIDASAFSFDFSRSLSNRVGTSLPNGKEVVELKVVTANRESVVKIHDGATLDAGGFVFGATQASPLAERIVGVAKAP